MTESTLARFMAKFVVEPNGCWRWTAATTKAGYGKFMLDGRRVIDGQRVQKRRLSVAHRVAYEHWRGPIPLPQLDHLCRNRWCVNPWHLEPVTNQENAQRGRLVTRCVHGQPYTPENTGWHKRPTGDRRYCKTCVRESSRARYVPKPKPTHCKHGHEYAVVGRRPDGGCAECSRRRWHEWKARKRARL